MVPAHPSVWRNEAARCRLALSPTQRTRNASGVMIIAHISDTHLDGGARALARTRRVMRYLRGCRLDAILVSGDLADHGDAREYEEVRAELTADVPVLMLPGNHDR